MRRWRRQQRDGWRRRPRSASPETACLTHKHVGVVKLRPELVHLRLFTAVVAFVVVIAAAQGRAHNDDTASTATAAGASAGSLLVRVEFVAETIAAGGGLARAGAATRGTSEVVRPWALRHRADHRALPEPAEAVAPVTAKAAAAPLRSHLGGDPRMSAERGGSGGAVSIAHPSPIIVCLRRACLAAGRAADACPL